MVGPKSCPKCGGTKTFTLSDNLPWPGKYSKTHRVNFLKERCESCGHIFMTEEQEEILKRRREEVKDKP